MGNRIKFILSKIILFILHMNLYVKRAYKFRMNPEQIIICINNISQKGFLGGSLPIRSNNKVTPYKYKSKLFPTPPPSPLKMSPPTKISSPFKMYSPPKMTLQPNTAPLHKMTLPPKTAPVRKMSPPPKMNLPPKTSPPP